MVHLSAEPDLEQCRAALRKVLDSECFADSRRLSDFLAYSGNAALEGRTEMDQYEIAERVLGQSSDFNPLENASVRKLGTRLRQKLDQYYAGPGAEDGIGLSLPHRSYMPRFRWRETHFLPSAEAQPEPESPIDTHLEPIPAAPSAVPFPLPPRKRKAYRKGWAWLLAGVVLGTGALGLVSARILAEKKAPSGKALVIHTAAGDIRGNTLDVAPDAVRTGTSIRDEEEVVARLRFSPDHPAQQAGVMAMVDADHFVRFGSHFKDRTLMEFGQEIDGKYQVGSVVYAFDPLGQLGLARWFALRRSGDNYHAFLSSDGFSWRDFGPTFNMGGDARAAIYAFNGRTSGPSTTATFDGFGTALSFHNRPDGEFPPGRRGQWSSASQCVSPVSARIVDDALQIGFAGDARGCSWSLRRTASPGDWALSAFVDFEPVSGSSIELRLSGAKRSVSLSRKDPGGRSIMLERAGDRDVRVPDLRGTPPLILRFEKVGETIRAAFSSDGDTYVQVGTVQVDELGKLDRISIIAMIARWAGEVSRPPARLYWIREEPVTPGRLTGRNVPARTGT